MILITTSLHDLRVQMHLKESAQSYFLGTDTFMITIYPHIDYVLIVALVVILDAINAGYDF